MGSFASSNHSPTAQWLLDDLQLVSRRVRLGPWSTRQHSGLFPSSYVRLKMGSENLRKSSFEAGIFISLGMPVYSFVNTQVV